MSLKAAPLLKCLADTLADLVLSLHCWFARPFKPTIRKSFRTHLEIANKFCCLLIKSIIVAKKLFGAVCFIKIITIILRSIF